MSAAATTGSGRRRRAGQGPGTSPLEGPISSSPTPLPRGAEVEVRVDDEGFHGSCSWYEATVVDFAPAEGGRAAEYTATYSHLLADGGGGSVRTEVFPPSHVRPRPSPPSESSGSPPRFHLYDIVEAFHGAGWWSGIVMSCPDPGASASVTVGFPMTREVIKFLPHLVRPRRDYVDGDWVPSRAAMAASSYKLRIFEVGEKVEVGRHRDLYGYSWFPATVTRVIDDLSYVVEYSWDGGEGRATEYVHWQFIRPAEEHFRRDSESRSLLVPGSAVEAYCDGAWSPGEVREVIGRWKYKVIVHGKKEEILVTKVAELLKPQNCCNVNRKRIATAKWPANLRPGEGPCSHFVGMASNDDKHSHQHPESSPTKKSRKFLKQLDGIVAEGPGQSPMRMDTPLSDQNRNDHVCAGHLAAEVQQDGQNAGSSQCSMDSSALRSCSTSSSLLSSILAHSQVSDDQDLFAENSPVWSQMEAMAVFKVLPQRPHFLPLREFPPTMHEGMALGLMCVFSDLVEITEQASIHKSLHWYDDKLSTLRHLEGHGFSVQPLYSTLTRLVEIKSQFTVGLMKKFKLKAELVQGKEFSSRLGAQLHKNYCAIAELKQEIERIRHVKDNNDREISGLHSEISRLNKACGDAERKFCSVWAQMAALAGTSEPDP